MTIPDNVTSLDQMRPEGDRLWNEKKKERARAQLIDAATRLIAARGLDSVGINDLTTECAMAPGTFYNYFPSLDAVVDELAAVVVAGLEESAALRGKARDPGTRIALVLRNDLRRAREDANWGRLLIQFATRTAYPVRAALSRCLEDDVREGIAKGQFVAEVDESAQDLVLGALLAGIARVAEGGLDASYDSNLTANVLRGLGMVSVAALERAQRGI
jgi:AcrR family transcriptional regulator